MNDHDDSPVRLVCFDLGGVLVRIARDWTEACSRAGVQPAGGADDAWARHQALMLRYETGELDEAGYLREVPACQVGMSNDHLTRVFDAWLLGLYPGVPELLDELRARGLRTACLSNTNERHYRTLFRTPEFAPLTKLDHLFASYEIRVMKPDERAYRHVERATGAAGGQVLFFDDKQENVKAARAIGWRAETIDPAADPVHQIRQFLAAHGAA